MWKCDAIMPSIALASTNLHDSEKWAVNVVSFSAGSTRLERQIEINLDPVDIEGGWDYMSVELWPLSDL